MNLTKLFSILGTLLLLVLTHQATATEYTYDPLNRLTQIVYDNGDSITYGYDKAGNMTNTTSVVNSPPAITLTSPVGGETWQAGSNYTILWTSTGMTGDEVSVELYYNGALHSTIATNTPNNGTYSWTIPATLTPDAIAYKIKVTSTTNAAYFGMTPGAFTITTGSDVLSTVSINGPSLVDEESSASYTATAEFSDGSSISITDTATWSEDSPYATVSMGALTTSSVPADSTVNISISYTSSGQTKVATKSVTIQNLVDPVTLTSLAISGADAVDENSTAQYTVTATYSDGSTSVVTGAALWSENSAAATINGGLLSTGEVSSDSQVTISTAYTEDGVTKTATKDVTINDVITGSLVSLIISGSSTVNENGTAYYTATASFSDGSTLVVTNETTWSENSLFATINQYGVLSVLAVDQDTPLDVSAQYTYGVSSMLVAKTVIIRDIPPGRGSIAPIIFLLFAK